ncbi:hypothetical protein ACFQMB_09550 [Pseudobowmanella zhangzhouensis]|uniref:hypothetical protein n=1 Tax=Pseudobowmanella zhangzhouensis TaxID=1537679 RepID=UPI00361BCB4C
MKKPINSPSADERRQGKDAGVRFLELASIGGWIMFIIASIIFHFARPELQTGVQRFWGIETRAEWNATLLPYLQGLLAICVLLSLAALCYAVSAHAELPTQAGVMWCFCCSLPVVA